MKGVGNVSDSAFDPHFQEFGYEAVPGEAPVALDGCYRSLQLGYEISNLPDRSEAARKALVHRAGA